MDTYGLSLNDSARTLVMGVVNVTPDSFSDGGRLTSVAAVAHALKLLEDGADILDIGGESTRPGAAPVSVEEELARVMPVIEGVRQRTDAAISIDTMKPEVARASFAAGANIWNDVNALRADGALAVAAELCGPVILMHMAGEPRTMQENPYYDDVVAEVIGFLNARAEAALAAGIARADLFADPGIGFGKTLAHNLALMRALPRIESETGLPVVFGASRKRFVYAIDEAGKEAGDRIGGSLAAALYAANAGVRAVRVHDVRETVQALRVWAAIKAP